MTEQELKQEAIFKLHDANQAFRQAFTGDEFFHIRYRLNSIAKDSRSYVTITDERQTKRA